MLHFKQDSQEIENYNIKIHNLFSFSMTEQARNKL